MRDILSPIPPRPSVSRPLLAFIMMCTATAAWLSQGAIAAVGTGTGRVALLPVSIPAFALCVGAAAGVLVACRAGASLAPLWMLVLVVLPWLPRSLPAAFLIWSGPAALIVWLAVALSIGSTAWSARVGHIAPRERDCVAAATDRRAARVPRLRCRRVAGFAVRAGRRRAALPDHHPESAQGWRSEDREQSSSLAIITHTSTAICRSRTTGALVATAQIYSIHAPGLPLLIAPAFALAGYHGVVVFLVLVAATGGALAWHLAWLVTRRADAAWFGWAAVSLSTSAIFHSFTVYPDGVGGVIVLTGIWALLRAERGGAFRHERRASLAAARRCACPSAVDPHALRPPCRQPRCARSLAVRHEPNAGRQGGGVSGDPGLSALAGSAFSSASTARPDPSVSVRQRRGFGQVHSRRARRTASSISASVCSRTRRCCVCAFAGLGRDDPAARRATPRPRAAVRADVPYLLAVTHFAMWWGGIERTGAVLRSDAADAAVPAAVAWTAIRHRATRATALAALAFTMFVSGVPDLRRRRPARLQHP